MALRMIRLDAACLALTLSLGALPAHAEERAARDAAEAMAQSASPYAIAEYRRLLQEYQAARGAFEQASSAYWGAIVEKRRGRNAKRRDHQAITLDDYVLQQPPVYTG